MIVPLHPKQVWQTVFSMLTAYVMQTPPESADANIQNSYLVNEGTNGEGHGSLTELGLTYKSFPC